jgi:hypothetical protein
VYVGEQKEDVKWDNPGWDTNLSTHVKSRKRRGSQQMADSKHRTANTRQQTENTK